jgi:hypothetical protein
VTWIICLKMFLYFIIPSSNTRLARSCHFSLCKLLLYSIATC